MTKAAIEKLMEAGANEAIRKKLSSVLWQARKHLEDASKDCPRDFSDGIAGATKLIDDAWDLYRALPAPSEEESGG